MTGDFRTLDEWIVEFEGVKARKLAYIVDFIRANGMRTGGESLEYLVAGCLADILIEISHATIK